MENRKNCFNPSILLLSHEYFALVLPMDSSSPISFREFGPEDITFGMQLKHTANWNQVPEDWELLLRLNTGHHLIAEYDQHPAGTLTAVSYQKRFRWIGMLLVAPAYRKKGVGTALMEAALRNTDTGPAIRLDATPAGKLLYDKLGFQVERELYRMERTPQLLKQQTSYACEPIQPSDLAQIVAFDSPVFGANREIILADLLQRSPQYAWCIRKGEEVVGYCLGRMGSHHVQIGPLVANDRAVARALLLQILHQTPHQAVILDTFTASTVWMDMLIQLRFNRKRPLTRMVKGTLDYPGLPHRQFAIAGPELG